MTIPGEGGGNAKESGRQGGTRVFKKSSPNGKITAYLGILTGNDFLTHLYVQVNAILSII